VHSVFKAGAAAGGWQRSRVTRGRIALLAGVAALGTLAITAAVALPSRSAATAPVRVALPPVADQGAIIPPHASEADVGTEPRQPAAADIGARRFTGKVGADMSRSLLAAGVPEQRAREYIALLARAIDLAGGLTVDDKFDLVIERTPDGKLARLLYAGLDRVGRADVELLKWTDGKEVIWVNADGVGGESQQGMRMPVAGRVTSGFGERFHPILGYQRFHAGLDLAATFGSPIAAAADGRVVSAGWHGGYGRLVAVMHGGGIETLYGHMSQIAARPGELVRQGQVIGYVGSSGLSTGPHLHYEVLKNGRPVNPLSVKLAGGPAQLEGEKLHQFHDALRALLVLKAG
jgi:murein DD-endopeptidase MepM/ murein hydrolase activator NlpD